MARGDDGRSQSAEIERPVTGRDVHGNLGRVRFFDIWRQDSAAEARLRRRARRQALALMIASATISVAALYAVWVMLLG